MALTSLLQKEGGGVGAQDVFSCFADQRIGDKSTTHCISNCGGIQRIGRISYCSNRLVGGKAFFTLVTAARSLGWLGGFRQVHPPVPPAVGSWRLWITLRQSLC